MARKFSARVKNQADVADWLTRAEQDLEVAKILVRERSSPEGAYLHIHQAIEKALKAAVYANKAQFTPGEIKGLRTHSLPKLVGAVEGVGWKLPERAHKAAAKVDPYFMPARYPDVPIPEGGFTQESAQEAIGLAREVVDFVKGKVEDK